MGLHRIVHHNLRHIAVARKVRAVPSLNFKVTRKSSMRTSWPSTAFAGRQESP